jgi:hypothetical protein
MLDAAKAAGEDLAHLEGLLSNSVELQKLRREACPARLPPFRLQFPPPNASPGFPTALPGARRLISRADGSPQRTASRLFRGRLVAGKFRPSFSETARRQKRRALDFADEASAGSTSHRTARRLLFFADSAPRIAAAHRFRRRLSESSDGSYILPTGRPQNIQAVGEI